MRTDIHDVYIRYHVYGEGAMGRRRVLRRVSDVVITQEYQEYLTLVRSQPPPYHVDTALDIPVGETHGKRSVRRLTYLG